MIILFNRLLRPKSIPRIRTWLVKNQ
jgi:hypothetical protein